MAEHMTDLLLYATAITSTVWVVNRFWGTFFERKKASLLSVILWTLYCALQAWMMYSHLHVRSWFRSTVPNFLIHVTLLYLIVICSFEAAGRDKYYLYLLYCIMWMLTEISLEFLFYFLKLDWKAGYIVGVVSTAILTITFSSIVSVLWDKKYKGLLPGRFILVLLPVPAVSIYITLAQYRHPGDSPIIASSITAMLLLLNLTTFDVYIRICRFFFREQENAIHAEQLSLISQNMEEQKKLMEEFYEEKHDLINELTVLRGKMTKDSHGEALESLDRILDCYHGMGSISQSGNSAVDAVINAKYAAAKKYGISFHLQISVPEELAIESRDLGVVIGNALDNAIAAVRECSFAEKVIQISMGVRKNAWIMVMKNPYEHAIKRNRNGEIISGKPAGERHGYGLRSIKRIAKSYDGDVIIDTDGGWFSLTVVLNCSDF